MPLVLSWKFFDQNITMTRMKAGRVVLFDFSTEYDVIITDKFLNYMKHEEMSIVISQVDKHDEPFASCTLPLRDALLHTNRRADMSLALSAGPQMRRALGTDPLDAGDEVGVLDLWCMLRAESRLLPVINKAIAKQSLLRMNKTPSQMNSLPNSSQIIQQVLDEDQSNERLSEEFDLSMCDRDRKTLKRYAQHRAACSKTAQESFAASCDLSSNRPSQKSYLEYDVQQHPNRGRRSSQSVRSAFMDRDSEIIPNEVSKELQNSSPLKNLQQLDDNISQTVSSICSLRSPTHQRQLQKMKWLGNTTGKCDQKRQSIEEEIPKKEKRWRFSNISFGGNKTLEEQTRKTSDELSDPGMFSKCDGRANKGFDMAKKSVTIQNERSTNKRDGPQKDIKEDDANNQSVDITILWLALNEECEVMMNPDVQRLYIAYSFLGRNGADLETPVSLPKPKHYIDKCHFNFKKTFQLHECDLPLLGHMARCRHAPAREPDSTDCITFTVVSEPPEDPLGLAQCEDIGQTRVFLGDILACSADSNSYTEVVPVRGTRGGILGVLAIRLDGLHIVQRCLNMNNSFRKLTTLEH